VEKSFNIQWMNDYVIFGYICYVTGISLSFYVVGSWFYFLTPLTCLKTSFTSSTVNTTGNLCPRFALTALFWGRLYQRMILSQFYRPLGAARDSE